jgi:hypothetical protein
MEYLDNYINGENLEPDELIYIHKDQLRMFAYEMKDRNDYERIKGGLAILQLSCGRGFFIKEVSYILDHTALTEWQKFKLKFHYMFL